MPFAALLAGADEESARWHRALLRPRRTDEGPQGHRDGRRQMGYEVVEFYSPYLNWTADAAKDVRKLLDDLGIKCHSTHNSVQALSAGIASRSSSTKSSAAKPSSSRARARSPTSTAGRPSRARSQRQPTNCVRMDVDRVPQSPPNGARLATRARWTSSPRARRKIRAATRCGTCVEAGVDPVAWIKANPGRIKSIPLKDWGKGEGRGYNVAFGDGDVQWKPLFEAAESVGGMSPTSSNRNTPAPTAKSRWRSGVWIITRSCARRRSVLGFGVRAQASSERRSNCRARARALSLA